MSHSNNIPLKIFVGGPFSSGKTAFIEAISETQVVKTERKIPKENSPYKQDMTIALDFGKITVDETAKLFLFGQPGARRLENIVTSFNSVDGLVILIDGVRPETFYEAKRTLRYCNDNLDIPYVIAVSKQDLPDAWSAQDIQIALKLKEPVIPCCAHDLASVKHVLLTLLERVLARIDEEEYEMKLADEQMCLQEREHG